MVYYYCLPSIVLLDFTMDGGALFCVCTEARTRVLTEMSEIRLYKNKVGGHAKNDANTLLTQIERVLERKFFEDSAGGMKGLASDVGNAINDYKSTVHIKKPPDAPAPTTVPSNQRSTTTATSRTKLIGRMSSASWKSASRRGSRRESPR